MGSNLAGSITLMAMAAGFIPMATAACGGSEDEVISAQGAATVVPVSGSSTPALPPNTPEPSASEMVPGEIEAAARNLLADGLGLNEWDFRLDSVEGVGWSDTSLGCPQEGMAYTQFLTPGYRLVFDHAGTSYPVHTKSDGSHMVVCGDGRANLDDAELTIATACEDWPTKPGYKATLYWEGSAFDASEGPWHPVNIRMSGNDYHLSVRNRGYWDGATEEWVRLDGQLYWRNHLNWKWEEMSGPDAENFFMWGPKCTGLVSHQALGKSETRDGRIAWLFLAKESESTFPNAQDGQSEFWVDAEGRLFQYQSQSQFTSVDSAAPKEELAFVATSVYFDIGQGTKISNPILLRRLLSMRSGLILTRRI